MFTPIAIVGRACLLPGAHTPRALFELARDARDELRDAPTGRWRVPPAHVLSAHDELDHAWTQRGGYVEDFAFDPAGYDVPAESLLGIDPLTQWVVDTARRALIDAAFLGKDRSRTGAIVGNLSLPSSGAARFAERVWLGPLAERLGLPPSHPSDRFNSGLPAHRLGRALSLGAGAYALDAACASSLYAIELAARELQEGRADVMLAGAVNRADDLFIHIGFSALSALSRTGRSRPFHAGADGLVPAEGCGFVVLERLEDAIRAGHTIHGVIRGVGLANDGRGKGLLAPSEGGQVRSMRIALEQAGLSPEDISYIECHATGTRVGDATELSSMATVYGERERELPIGSLKANFGHLITAAGIAGLIKVLECLREGEVLPTPHLDQRSDALNSSPFEALDRARPWSGPRRAGVSAFGFGGNDAHLIVEAHEPARALAAVPATPRSEIVAVALGARVGSGQSAADLERVLLGGATVTPADTVRIPMKELRFPPADLKKTSAQQTMLLSAALEATAGLDLPADTTGIFIGYGCDPEISRWGGRWRARSWGEALGAGEEWITKAADAFVAPLEAPHVIGTLPNIPANRLSSQLDLRGPSYTTSSEELSGIRALAIAIDGLRRGDLDAAIVGAVDLSEVAHRTALAGMGCSVPSGDAAVALVLRRREDAEAEALPILAEVDVSTDTTGGQAFVSGLPRAHAAHGLVELVGALVCTARGRHPDGSTWAEGERRLSVTIDALGGERASATVIARGEPCPPFAEAGEGPFLSLAAHQPTVALPSLPAVSRPLMQKMTPAPKLPPTSHDGPAAPPMPARAMLDAPASRPVAAAAPVAAPMPIAAPAPMPVVAPAQMPVANAAPPAIPAGTMLAAFTEQQVRIAEAHSAFIAQQAQLHQQFLSTLLTPPVVGPPTGAPAYAPPPVAVTPVPVARPLETPIARPATPAAPLAPSPAPTPAATKKPVAAPAPKAPVTEVPLAFRPRGPSFDREALRVHASGKISEIFGQLFEQQDEFAVQVRMPEPPLLLADRCTGIEAEPGSMTKGTCWTETDVREDSWYLHQGRMPAGIMIESGQADLFLISYLGADFLNQGERAYRLLGCEMTWQGDLPKIGETLVYDIHIDGHAAQGDVRLFFFHYDCHIRRPDGTTRPALQVRGGQAGFFTAGELDDSAGILWKPEDQEIIANARVDAPSVPLEARGYDRESIEAFAAGRPWECFGEGFLRSRTHTRTPRIQDGRMLFLDTIETLDPKGGPWGRGYLKAVTPISADDWFFDGHFKNDPCMPGTLMLEGCVQAMAFYLTAMGYTVEKDGWRFQPIPDESYALRCRGQVLPSSRELTYEVFVEEIHDGPVPRVYADLLCTVDGLGAFHARRFGLELAPGWPMDSVPKLSAEGKDDPRAAVVTYEDTPPFTFDYPSLIACAWGQPSKAFGPMYERFDGERRPARLPGPPYHFLTRITEARGPIGGMKTGTAIEFEYEVPPDVWYFDENGARVMPFAVLLEAALQPCGWTASYVGSALTTDKDMLFRNLDGKGTIKAEIFPESGTLRTSVEITNISQSAGMIIESFRVSCSIGDVEVYELDTVFGFFPPSAFENQAGLPTTDEQRAFFDAESNLQIDLTKQPERYCSGTLRLAEPMLLMIDRVTHFDREGGAAGLGRLRAEKDVNVDEWFFKAHFYQDPVQPGSLGIEAMLQLIQFFMIEEGMGEGLERPRFEGIAVDLAHKWKYRGQVVPKNGLITSTVEILETGEDARGRYVIAAASLWVDGKRIYEAERLGMRVVEGGPEVERKPKPEAGEEVLDDAVDTWLSDHCPTYTKPALPMMSIVDRMMAAARAERGAVDGLSDLRVERWVVIDGPTRIRTEIEGDEVRLLVWRDAADARLSRFEVAARATIGAPAPMEPLAPLGGTIEGSPYADDRLFHGPAFHYAKTVAKGVGGATAILDAGAGAVPFGTLHQGLLDAATHAIPHDRLRAWSPRISDDVVGYPRRLDVRFDGEAPREGDVRCEVRFAGFEDDDDRFPVFRLQLLVGTRVFADMRLVEILMPKGPLGAAAPSSRRRFLADLEPVAGVGLSRHAEGVTKLDPADVAISGWFPGTVETVYGTEDPREIAVKDHVAAARKVHPRHVRVRGDMAVDAHAPLTAHPIEILEADAIEVRDAGSSRLDITPVSNFWRTHFGTGRWPVEDVYYGLLERFLGDVHVEDPAALEALRGRGVLYLGNHQTGIESLIFSIVASALQGVPTLTLAKTEHRTSWLGELIAHCFTWPGVEDPGVITYFDRTDPTSLPRIAKELVSTTGARSLMVHVEGTRAHSARHRVEKMSGIFCDLAVNAGVPIVPVRFSGGLPVEPAEEKLEYPVGMGRQDYWLGTPITSEELAALPYKERIERVVRAIGELGPSPEEELPLAPDATLATLVDEQAAKTGVGSGLSTILVVLRERADVDPRLNRLLSAIASGDLDALGDGPEERWLQQLGEMLTTPAA